MGMVLSLLFESSSNDYKYSTAEEFFNELSKFASTFVDADDLLIAMKSRKWRSLLHKVEYLKLDLEEKEDEIRTIEAQFLTRLSEVDPGFSAAQRPSQPVNDGESVTDAEVQVHVVDKTGDGAVEESPTELPSSSALDDRPDDMRKLWKAIAVATHPDKTGGDPHKTELYKRASRAWDDRKYEELISIALDLDIPTEEADDNAVTLLEARSGQISERISQIEGSVLWQWHRAPPDKKDAIIRLYLASKGRRK